MVRTGVTRAYGANLRQIISKSINNRFKAFAVGLAVTGVLQSSTATALMVASFASRGLMATAPALAVMLGADVGTTIVAQVLSFDLSWLSPSLLAIGVITHLSSKTSLTKQLGRTAIGLGLMLLSLKLIVTTSVPLRESQVLTEVFGSLASDVIMGVLIAAILTWLTHSSLAVVLLVMSMAASGAVPLPLALALVLGANLGGTLPPIMATMGGTPEARRVPIGNAIFKLAGVIALLPVIAIIAEQFTIFGTDPARAVVNFHTIFNFMLAVVFIGLTGPVAKLSIFLFPDVDKTDDPGQSRHLDQNDIDNPVTSLINAARETLRMGDIVETMLSESLEVLAKDDAENAKSVRRMDDVVDRLHEEIKLYTTAITRHEMDDKESLRAVEIMAFSTNLEHIGDIIDNLMEISAKKIKNRMQFSKEGHEELYYLHTRVVDNLKLAMAIFLSSDVKLARRLLAEKKEIVALERAGAEGHMARLRAGRTESIESSALHMDILRDLKRINSHIVAVAYPILEQAGELDALKKPAEHEPMTNKIP